MYARQSRRRVRGPRGVHTSESCVFICDECVALCAQVNADVMGTGIEAPKSEALPPAS